MPRRPRRWFHQLSNYADHLDELLVVSSQAFFDFIEPLGDLSVDGENPTQVQQSCA